MMVSVQKFPVRDTKQYVMLIAPIFYPFIDHYCGNHIP